MVMRYVRGVLREQGLFMIPLHYVTVLKSDNIFKCCCSEAGVALVRRPMINLIINQSFDVVLL